MHPPHRTQAILLLHPEQQPAHLHPGRHVLAAHRPHHTVTILSHTRHATFPLSSLTLTRPRLQLARIPGSGHHHCEFHVCSSHHAHSLQTSSPCCSDLSNNTLVTFLHDEHIRTHTTIFMSMSVVCPFSSHATLLSLILPATSPRTA